jgi:uncharacterized membrane protein YjdF
MNPEKAIENHREILLRFTPLQKGGWFYFIVFSIVLAIAASWELLEWWGGRDLTAMLPKLFLKSAEGMAERLFARVRLR